MCYAFSALRSFYTAKTHICRGLTGSIAVQQSQRELTIARRQHALGVDEFPQLTARVDPVPIGCAKFALRTLPTGLRGRLAMKSTLLPFRNALAHLAGIRHQGDRRRDGKPCHRAPRLPW